VPYRDKKLAGVILNYNNWQDTLACAESVLASEERPAWMILVDNASNNDSLRWIRHWAKGNLEFVLPELGVKAASAKPLQLTEYFGNDEWLEATQGKVFLIRNAINRGYAAGNNVGISLALALGADAVWILNNDTLVDKKALGCMRDRLFSQKRSGLCGPLIQYMDNSGLVQCRAGGVTNKWTGLSVLDGNKMDIQMACFEDPKAIEQRINFIYGASVMASREFIETVGMMDESYFLYCEEQDWACRANNRFDLVYAPRALVYHKEGGSTGFSHQKFCSRSLWHLVRSRLILTWKHTPYAIPTVCLCIVYAGFRMAIRRMLLKLVAQDKMANSEQTHA